MLLLEALLSTRCGLPAGGQVPSDGSISHRARRWLREGCRQRSQPSRLQLLPPSHTALSLPVWTGLRTGLEGSA